MIIPLNNNKNLFQFQQFAEIQFDLILDYKRHQRLLGQ